ncbi:hypothetical protein [Kitasatospora camelliae]|uniref:Integral membrane protein n=1 Tax=Kitasatospora camelliae TaxID=3156397 RepID=A0AAU8K0H4_9ACTN
MTDHHAAPRRGTTVPAARPAAAGWDLRLLRAVPFALVCTLIAAAGHALVGGGDVAPSALLLGFTVVCAAAVLLGGRERSMAAIAGLLGLGQLGLHGLFHGTAAAAAHHAPGLAETAGRLLCDDRTGNGLTPVPAGTTAEQVVSAAGLDPQAYVAAPASATLFGLTPAMLAGHLAAAVLAGWWLRRGEAALWRVVRLTADTARSWAEPLRTALALALVLLLGPLAACRPGAQGRDRAGDRRLPAAAALRHSLVRRGPPVAAFAR